MPYPNMQVLVLVYSVREKQPQAKRKKNLRENLRIRKMKGNRKSFAVEKKFPFIHNFALY